MPGSQSIKTFHDHWIYDNKKSRYELKKYSIYYQHYYKSKKTLFSSRATLHSLQILSSFKKNIGPLSV